MLGTGRCAISVMADNVDLEQRIIHLETVVAELQKTIEQLTTSPVQADKVQTDYRAESERRADLGGRQFQASDPHNEGTLPAVSKLGREKGVSLNTLKLTGVNREEFWLNRLGIGLLLLGVAFLFKYSIDQGWIVPAVRVAFGIGLGIALFVMGWRLQRQRMALSQILIGGSIGTFYITGFAAYQLFGFLTYPAAFVWMVTVTALAFLMSVRANQAVLSVVGAIGGLGTPFLLYSDQGNPVGLVGYTCLILIGTSAIYFRQGWKSLLWTTFIGVGMIFCWVVFSTISLAIVGGDSTATSTISRSELMGIQLALGSAGLRLL